jgi:hypothetical protein
MSAAPPTSYQLSARAGLVGQNPKMLLLVFGYRDFVLRFWVLYRCQGGPLTIAVGLVSENRHGFATFEPTLWNTSITTSNQITRDKSTKTNKVKQHKQQHTHTNTTTTTTTQTTTTTYTQLNITNTTTLCVCCC